MSDSIYYLHILFTMILLVIWNYIKKIYDLFSWIIYLHTKVFLYKLKMSIVKTCFSSYTTVQTFISFLNFSKHTLNIKSDSKDM